MPRGSIEEVIDAFGASPGEAPEAWIAFEWLPRSIADGNGPVDGERPSISDDGNRIAFTQYANVAGDSADTNGFEDVYVRDVAAGTSALASRAAGSGAVGNGASYSPAIAGDGSAVAFESKATNFDNIQDSDARPDIYWRSLAPGGNTALVDVNAAGDKAYESYSPSIDDSGWQVGFVSKATNLDPADTDSHADTYVKHLLTNELRIASRADGPGGAVANADASAVSVSGNGGRVVSSLARGITPDSDPRMPNVILRELSDAQHTFTIGRPAGDAPFVSLGGMSSSPVLSSDGRFAAFVSEAPGLGLPLGVPVGVFVRDRVTGAVTLASRADGPDGAPFNGNPYGVAISGDGRRVAFAFADAYSTPQVWVRDLDAAKTYLASRADGGAGAEADAYSTAPSLDADGSRVSFTTHATNLGDGDTDDISDVHVRDLAAGRTILVSRADGLAGPKGNDGSRSGAINADGTRVAFASEATNLGDGDTDAIRDVHVRDLETGTTRLVSATPAGVKTDRSAGAPSIDSAGTRIAFDSVATNLVAGTLAEKRKVFVRDLAADTLVLASRADGQDGAAPNDHASNQLISPDGGYVAFVSSASNLGTVPPAGESEVYRRDLAAGTTRLVSRRSGPSGAPVQDYVLLGGISAGGGCVGFATRDALLGPPSEYVQSYMRVFRSDCAATDPDPAPGGDEGAGAGSSTAATTGSLVAPVLSGVRLTRKRFRVAPGATALSAAIRRGSVLRFSSSVRGRLTIVVERAKRGRPAWRRAGTLTRRVAAGPGRVRLTGRLGRRALRPGRYRLRVRVADAAGRRSKPVRLRFVIVRG